jgi:hypothetical protein
LLYTRYGFFVRLVMRLISKMAGGDTDTSRDYEYTDWNAVAEFARRFSSALAERQSQARKLRGETASGSSHCPLGGFP